MYICFTNGKPERFQLSHVSVVGLPKINCTTLTSMKSKLYISPPSLAVRRHVVFWCDNVVILMAEVPENIEFLFK